MRCFHSHAVEKKSLRHFDRKLGQPDNLLETISSLQFFFFEETHFTISIAIEYPDSLPQFSSATFDKTAVQTGHQQNRHKTSQIFCK